MSFTQLASVVLAALLLLVAPATASRPPLAREAVSIRAAAEVFGRIYYRPSNPARIYVSRIRVSTRDRRFAAAHLTTSKKLIDQPIDLLLWRGLSSWAVITWGTEYLGCGLVSATVRKDLFGTRKCF